MVGGGGKTQTVTQQSDPWAGQQPYLSDVMRRAQSAYGQTSKDPYTGDLVADPNAVQLAGVNQQLDVANQLGGFGKSTIDLGQDFANRVASGSYTAPALQSNQQVTDAIMAQAQPVAETLSRDLIPQLKSNAIEQGAYGGARYNLTSDRVMESLTDEVARLSAADYQQRLAMLPQLQLLEQQGAALSPQLQQQGLGMNLQQGDLYSQIGAQQQLWQQDLLDEAYQQYLMSLNAPWQGLAEYASTVQGIPAYSSTTQTSPTASTMSRVLSGALGGASLGGSAAMGLGGVAAGAGLGAFAPWILPGALLGGMFGLF